MVWLHWCGSALGYKRLGVYEWFKCRFRMDWEPPPNEAGVRRDERPGGGSGRVTVPFAMLQPDKVAPEKK